MSCLICKKLPKESFGNYKQRLYNLISTLDQILYNLSMDCIKIIAEYIIGDKYNYILEIWTWTHHTSQFERDYDYNITYQNACRSCLEMATIKYYNIHGCTPCKLDDYIEDVYVRREKREHDTLLTCLKGVYFRKFLCDGWRNTNPYIQKNILGEEFITL